MSRPGLGIIAVCLLFGLTLTGCGGGGSGSNAKKTSSVSSGSSTTTTTTTSYYGVFQGSKVVGVHYRAELNGVVTEGETDAQGQFQYLSDGASISTVTFSVGGVELGAVTPTATTGAYSMNVHDLVSASDPDTGSKATNIQRFLSSVDTSTSTDTVFISAATRTALAGESVKLGTLPVAEFDTKAAALVNTLVSASVLPAGTAVAASSAVTAHMQETKVQIDAARVGTVQVTAGAESVLADGKTRVLVQVKATGLDGKALTGGLVRLETSAGTFGSETNLCADTTTVTTTIDRITDDSGVAFALLTPRCQSVNAVVTVSLGGVIVRKTIQFTSAPASNTTLYNGMFQGYALVGAHYRAELNGMVQEGETDAEGRFQFLSDGVAISPVTFSVGGVVLGSMTPTDTTGTYRMTIHDLVSLSDLNAAAKAINLQRFLSTINTATTTGVIGINAATRTALAGESVHLGLVPAGDFDARATTLVNTLITAQVLASGSVLVAPAVVTPLMQEIKTQIDATRIGTLEITSGAESVQADGKTRVLVQVKAKTTAGKAMAGGQVHFETSAGTFGNATDPCLETVPPVTAVDKNTDVTGVAYLFLTPRCQTAHAKVSASLGGMIVSTSVKFIAGDASASHSALTVSPAALLADGQSTATVTVSLRDVHNNPVVDGTTVTLLTDSGSVQGGGVVVHHLRIGHVHVHRRRQRGKRAFDRQRV
ncbi:MAG: hypothetical protein HQL99_06570 [Magnetococcales bacterium]|nr:hypothetical protein [Magnetococcales bacterium]